MQIFDEMLLMWYNKSHSEIYQQQGDTIMSYRRPNTGNSMNDYFSALSDFQMLSSHLLDAKNEESFEVWLEKLELIDKRSLLLFLRKHKEEIPEEHLRLARRRFSQKI